MGNGNTTGLLGVILEVCLDVLVCVVTDDLGGVLVRTNSTITAETPELTLYSTSLYTANTLEGGLSLEPNP